MCWQNPVHASGCPAAASAQGYGALGQKVVVFAAAVQEGKKALVELLQETLLLSPVGPVLSVGLEHGRVAPHLPGLSGRAQSSSPGRQGTVPGPSSARRRCAEQEGVWQTPG